MKEFFKSLILEFQEMKIPKLHKRNLDFMSVPSSMRKAIVLIGMRRSGKTWCLYQKMQSLLEQDLDKKKILYINFEDDRLIGFNPKDYQSILEAYYELYPENIDSPDVHFFFDEIHEMPYWEKFIRRLLDKEQMQIYLTGSSAKLLSKEIATGLRGRTISKEIFPFSFQEILKIKGLEFGENQSFKRNSVMVNALDSYLLRGGFPEIQEVEESLFREIIQGYVDIVIYRDIIDRYNISNTHALQYLLKVAIQNSASSLSINKIYNSLKSMGIKVSKDSLYEFLKYFEDAYCLFSINAFNFSTLKTSTKSKKIYPIDSGLISAFSIKKEFDKWAAFETTVFLHLRRRFKDIFYYETKSSKEVDFLVIDCDGSNHLIQACLFIDNESTLAREVSALLEAMTEISLDTGTILTLNESHEIIEGNKQIKIVPFQKYLATLQQE